MDMVTFHTIWTVILFVSFIGIIVWAYSKRQKTRFTEAANLVFADDELDKTTLESERSKEA